MLNIFADVFRAWGGPGIRRLLVIAAFLGIPIAVFWSAWPLIQELPMSTSMRQLMVLSVVAMLAFGGASGVLVWRDLDREP